MEVKKEARPSNNESIIWNDSNRKASYGTMDLTNYFNDAFFHKYVKGLIRINKTKTIHVT